ncbi:MAG: McrB family protein [Ignavibacteria bacterium]
MAKVVTREQVLAALEHLSAHTEIKLSPPKKYEFTYKGRAFPPKEVVRWAAQLAEIPGWKEYRLMGGPLTNDYLVAMQIPGAALITKGEEHDPVMPYFDLEGMERYREIAGTQYSAANPNGRSWFRDTESKLEYLVALLSDQIDETLAVNYTLRPNQQAGRGKIIFSDYVLVGCCPEEDKHDNSVFVKIAFHNLSDPQSLFAVEIDSNKRLEGNQYVASTEPIRLANAWHIPLDAKFPDNWKDLVELIHPEVEKHLQLYRQVKQKEAIIIQPPKIMVNRAFSLNTILYGPPGTGKTYKTILRAAEIITGESFENRYDAAKELYKKLLGDQVQFITFHQNYSYEDFVAGLRPDTSPDNFQLRFKEHKGIFYKICKWARDNYNQHMSGQTYIEPDFDEVLNEFLKPLAERDEPIQLSTIARNVSFKIYAIFDKNLGLERQTGGREHTLSLTTLKALYEGKREFNLQGLGIYYRPLIDKLKEIAKGLRKETGKVELKKYVLIIDEINRANISRVFGELITLLEPDKRLGAKHELSLTLPGLPDDEKFSVPPNLYIVGTMNTADKSIALLDIALRRRFYFEPLYPDKNIPGVNFPDILEAINIQILDKKNADFLIGHAYFMNDENDKFDLADMMNHKIIPLMTEYFYSQRGDIVKNIIEEAIKGKPMKVDYDNYKQLKFSVLP